MDIKSILLHNVVYCILLSVTLLFIVLKNPRLLLQDYPKKIRQTVASKTKLENKQSIIFSIPFLFVFVGYPGIIKIIL